MVNKKAVYFTVIILLIILLSGSIYIYKTKDVYKDILKLTKEEPFDVNQFLIKILVKEGESLTKDIKIMNKEKQFNFNIDTNKLKEFISFSEDSFKLNSFEEKNIKTTFNTVSNNLKLKPGVHVGKLTIKADEFKKEIPLIIEVESDKVSVDANLNLFKEDILLGNDFNIDINLFNLKAEKPAKINLEYLISDLEGDKIITEDEEIIIETQTSFSKTFKTKNLKKGEYVFSVKIDYENFVGTSSTLFSIISLEPEANPLNTLVNACKKDKICLSTLGALIILLIIFSAYVYFLIGSLIHRKVGATEIIEMPKEVIEEKHREIKKEISEEEIKKPISKTSIFGSVLFLIIIVSSYIFYLKKSILLPKLATLKTNFIPTIRPYYLNVISKAESYYPIIKQYYLKLNLPSYLKAEFYFVLAGILALFLLILTIIYRTKYKKYIKEKIKNRKEIKEKIKVTRKEIKKLNKKTKVKPLSKPLGKK